MHATKRAQMIEGGATLIFGAGAVGLLCGAMSRVAGSGKVVITDILAERVNFAVKNGFAHAGFVVPRNCGQNIDEKLESAREIARLACQMQTTNGDPPSEYERVFECTGVEACTQSAIYVRVPRAWKESKGFLMILGNSCRRKSHHRRDGNADPNSSPCSGSLARSRHRWHVSVRKHISKRHQFGGEQQSDAAGPGETGDASIPWSGTCAGGI